MREGTTITIFIGILIAYFSITWIIYDWVTKPTAEIIISFFNLETEGSLNEGITKLSVQLFLPIIVGSFGYAIVKVFSDITKDLEEFRGG